MLTFFLLLLLFFIVIPALRVMWRISQIRSAFKKQQQRANDMFNRARQPKPEPRKKKIDPNVGEYVAFEEIKTSTTVHETTEADGSTRIKVESQIEDAVWEEIK